MSGRVNTHPAVGFTAGDLSSNGHVRCGLGIISPDILFRDACLGELVIQQHTSAGSPLSVDILYSCQILNPFYAERISRSDKESLDSSNGLDQHHLLAREQRANIRFVVNTSLFIQKVRGGDVSFSPFEGHQPAKTSDVRAREPDPAGFSGHQVGNNVEKQVVTSDTYQSLIQLFSAAEQVDGDKFTGFVAFLFLRNDAESVCTHHTHRGAGTSCQRGADIPASDASDSYAHILSVLERGDQSS